MTITGDTDTDTDTAGFEGFAGYKSHPDAKNPPEDGGRRAQGSGNETLQTPKPRTAAEPSPAVAWLSGVLEAIGSSRSYASSTVWQCPSHEDAHPSLNVSTGRDGKAVIFCHAGCDWPAILAAIGIPARYLFTSPPVAPAAYAAAFLQRRSFPPLSRRAGHSPQSRGYRLEAIHDYGPEHRVLRYRRGTKKEIFWETRHGNLWEPGLDGVPTSALPIYNEKDVIGAVALGDPVLIVESESSADRIVRTTGLLATTWAGGASSVQLTALDKVLLGYRHIVVIPDNDPPGLAAAATLHTAGLAPHVVMPELHEDARDLLERVGHERFRNLVTAALR